MTLRRRHDASQTERFELHRYITFFFDPVEGTEVLFTYGVDAMRNKYRG